MTIDEFVLEWKAWCTGCYDGSTTHTVEEEEMRKLFGRVVTEERERCAKVAEEYSRAAGINEDEKGAALEIAALIRAGS